MNDNFYCWVLMVEARIVPYDEERHRDQFYQLTHEYLTWVNEQVFIRYGAEVFPCGDVHGFLADARAPKMLTGTQASII